MWDPDDYDNITDTRLPWDKVSHGPQGESWAQGKPWGYKHHVGHEQKEFTRQGHKVSQELPEDLKGTVQGDGSGQK